VSVRRFRRPHLLLTVPMIFGAAAFVAFLSSSAPAAPQLPDPQLPTPEGHNAAQDPTPPYTEAERRQLVAEGKDLFFSRTAFGQQPSQGLLIFGQLVSCASCHDPALGFADGLTHLVTPVGREKFARRQTPGLVGVAHTAPYGWDGRNPTLQAQARGAIVSPLEMHASREPTKRELDALAEFQATLAVPKAVPGKEYDPARAARGEVLFRTPRPVTDPTGEFPAGAMVACATCHSGPFFTDNKGHRGLVLTGDPVIDQGEVRPDGTVVGFQTPSLLALRLTAPYFHNGSGGDPTAPSNFLSGSAGRHSLDGDIGSHGAAVARRALLDNVLPFYNTVRFNFRFTDDELSDIAEFLLSL
jgi:cytochrome c peroxidase